MTCYRCRCFLFPFALLLVVVVVFFFFFFFGRSLSRKIQQGKKIAVPGLFRIVMERIVESSRFMSSNPHHILSETNISFTTFFF